jgi:porin
MIRKFLTLLIATSIFSGLAISQDEASTELPATALFSRETVTGEWLGGRPFFEERGVSFFGSYTCEVWGNTTGGLRSGAVYTGLLDFGAEVDLEKLANWHGGSVGTTWLWLSGRDASEDLVGNFLTLSNIAGFNTLRMMELWFQQNFQKDKISLRLGNITADSEFLVSDYGGLFINAAFGWPALASMNMPAGGAAYPVGGLGARLAYQPTEAIGFRTGVFLTDLIPQNINRAGFRWDLNAKQAVTWINEVSFSHGGGEGGCGLPGFVKAGMWLQTGAEANALDPGTNLPNTGFYLLADQMLFAERNGEGVAGDEGLGGFAGIGFAPPNRNVVDFYLNSGLTYKGLIPGREEDNCGVAFGLASLSGGADGVLREEGLSPQAAEMALEVTYQFVLAPWCFVQPDLQYIINPGSAGNSGNALVLGARFSVVF